MTSTDVSLLDRRTMCSGIGRSNRIKLRKIIKVAEMNLIVQPQAFGFYVWKQYEILDVRCWTAECLSYRCRQCAQWMSWLVVLATVTMLLVREWSNICTILGLVQHDFKYHGSLKLRKRLCLSVSHLSQAWVHGLTAKYLSLNFWVATCKSVQPGRGIIHES